MKRAQTRQLTLILMVMATGLLAAAVLLWGTEYKLSLYHHRKPVKVPYAKLLSEKERPAGVDVLSARIAVPAAVVALGLLGASAIWWRRDSPEGAAMREQRPSHRYRVSCLSHFFFRPPPAAA